MTGEMRSPDGRVRVDVRVDRDDRTGPWTDIAVHVDDGGEPIVRLPSNRSLDDLRFAPGEVVLAFTDGWGRPWQVLIDIDARTYRLHPHDEPEPLAGLPGRITRRVEAPAVPAAPPRFGTRVLDALNIAGCAVFVAAGAWMALAAETTKERWIGAFGVVFFGACLWVAWRDRRR
jgi:hypothetical protein